MNLILSSGGYLNQGSHERDNRVGGTDLAARDTSQEVAFGVSGYMHVQLPKIQYQPWYQSSQIETLIQGKESSWDI